LEYKLPNSENTITKHHWNTRCTTGTNENGWKIIQSPSGFSSVVS